MPDVYSVEHSGKLRHSSQYTEEIDALLRIIKNSGAKTALEIGVFEGGTSVLLHHAMGEDSVVVGVDLEDPGLDAPWFRFVKGHSTSYFTCTAVNRAVDGKPFDLIFIDAEHTEASALSEYEMYRHYLSENGLVAFHDICMPELWPMWNRLRGQRPLMKSIEIVRDLGQGACGIGVLIGR